MSRIRTIKPEFWSSEQVMECSPNARLAFIGMWNFCDDHGRHPWAPKQIKALVFPGDSFTSDDIAAMLGELASNGLIIRYAVDGKEYFQVTGWHHQKIDKPQKPRFPVPVPEPSATIPGMVAEQSALYLHINDQHISDLGTDQQNKNSNEFCVAAQEGGNFGEFWDTYPHKVGESETRVAYAEALTRATPEEILDGLKRYIGAKPDDRHWMNPAKFLGDKRFKDQPAAKAQPKTGFSPSEATASVPAGRVLVKPHTPAGDAWDRDFRARTGKGMPVSDKTGGWYCPSEYPPGYRAQTHEQPRAAQ